MMTEKRWNEIQKQIQEINDRVGKLNTERAALEAEREAVSSKDLIEFMPRWTGEKNLIGQSVHVDFEKWRILIRTGQYSYEVVDVSYLKEKKRGVALRIAEAISFRKWLGTGASNCIEIDSITGTATMSMINFPDVLAAEKVLGGKNVA